MEVCPRRYLSIEQVTLKSVMGCELNMKAREQTITHQPALSPRRVICPEPRRAVCAPHVVDTLNRKCCKPKSYLPSSRGSSNLEILNIILAKDESGENTDASSNGLCFFNGSPPVRTSNPLIYDARFSQQTSTCSPGGSQEAKPNSARVEKVSSCGTSLGGNPMVRIEGFSCRSSKSNRIVPAFA